LDRRKSWCR